MSRKNKTAVALLLVIALAFIVSALDRGGMLAFLDRTRRNRAPSDVGENLFYDQKKPSTSAHVLDRSGFAFLNLHDRIVAVQLSSGINVEVVAREGEQAPYRKFSEYAGYVYLHDGDSLWRTGIDGKRVSEMADGVVDYRPMGDHVYFIKTYRDEPRLFRCRLNGSGQEVLFDFPVHEFRAFAGRLLMLREQRDGAAEQRYTGYNVLNQRMEDFALPADAGAPELDGDSLYYIVADGGGQTLYRRPLAGGAAPEVVGHGFTDWEAGADGIAMLVRDGDGEALRYVDKKTGEERLFRQRRFSAGAEVDLSWDRVYVTDADGVFHSPVAREEWRILPVDGYGAGGAGREPAPASRTQGNQGEVRGTDGPEGARMTRGPASSSNAT